MQSSVLSRKFTKGFLDRLYRHTRESGAGIQNPHYISPFAKGEI